MYYRADKRLELIDFGHAKSVDGWIRRASKTRGTPGWVPEAVQVAREYDPLKCE